MTYNVRFNMVQLFKLPLVAALTYGVWQLRSLILLLVLALVISTFIEDFVVLGRKIKLKRIMSVVLFYVLGGLTISLVIFFIIPIFGQEFLALLESSPVIADAINNVRFIEGIRQFSSFENAVNIFRDFNPTRLKPLISVFGGIFNVFFVFIISFYLSVHEGIFEKLLLIATPRAHQKKVVSVWHRTQKKIGSWFRGQLIIALILVVLTYIGLTLLGLPYAFLLSLLAGIFGLVPYGIFLAIIPAMLIGFTSHGWYTGLFVLGLYLLIQQVLDYVLQPIILKRMTGIPSLLVILSVILGATLFGFIGVLIAVPMALFVIEIVAEIQQKKGVQIIEDSKKK